jgi:uncharacterized protein YegJ (DUF2314 family)
MNAFFRMIGRLVFKLIGRKPRQDDEPADSVVILLRETPSLTDEQISATLRRVFPSPPPRMLPQGEQPPPDYAPDAPPCRMIPFAADRGVYGLMVGSFPYTVTQLDESDPLLDDPAIKAFTTHQGWISIDFVTGKKPDDVYSVLGKIAAELIDENAALIFVPSLNLVAPPFPELVEAMQQGQWFDRLDVLTPALLADPVETSPAMVEAAQKARETFPDFVEAFRSGNGSEFSAKFSFADGQKTERLWVAVDEINGESILGTLGNEPEIIENMAEGDPITRTLDELEDWLYMCDGQMVGGYTVRAMLAERNEPES